MKAIRTPRAARGMTLVELMVGMAVGLFVATVAIATFVSTRTLNLVNASSTRMSENARLAMDVLQTDLRSSGFAGCRPIGQRQDDPIVSVLNGGVDAGFITEGSSGLLGYSGTGTGFTPALSAAIAAVPYPPLPTSDVISVRVPADSTALGVVAAMPTTSANPQLQAGAPGNTIVPGDVVLIANCKAATIFQVTEANPAATGVLSHATGGTPAPGNASADLRHAYRSDATVYRLQTRHYYVAPSLIRPTTNSLWRLSVPGTAVEVASGVDRVRVLYGIADDPARPQNVNRYVSASGVTSWDQVVSARLEMEISTPDDNMARTNQTYRSDGVTVTAADRRLHSNLTEVVTLRNSAP